MKIFVFWSEVWRELDWISIFIMISPDLYLHYFIDVAWPDDIDLAGAWRVVDDVILDYYRHQECSCIIWEKQ